jgi:hypothetical protein
MQGNEVHLFELGGGGAVVEAAAVAVAGGRCV